MYCKNQLCVEVFESRCFGMRIIGIENKICLPRLFFFCVDVMCNCIFLCHVDVNN